MNNVSKSLTNSQNQNASDAEEDVERCYDMEAWEMLSKIIQDVQSLLQRNRILIQQVNENHQSKIHDNIVKNVALIREINCNICKVRSLYSDLAFIFTNIVRQPRPIRKNGDTKAAERGVGCYENSMG